MRACFAAALLLIPGVLSAQVLSLTDLGWLAGCWERARPSSRMVELWLPPAQGVMLGTSYSVTDTSVRELEQLRLIARGDTLVYEAHPAGQARTDFRSTALSATELVFENPQHDFPTRITYRRQGADSLVARTEGDAASRQPPITFAFRRIPCGGLRLSSGLTMRLELQETYDEMVRRESRQAGGRFGWLAEHALPGYRYVIWSAAGSHVTQLDSLQLQRAAQGMARGAAAAARSYRAIVERVLVRGDTVQALVSATLSTTTVDSAGRVGPAGASHVRVVDQRWLDTWVRGPTGLRLRESAGLSEHVAMDGKPVIINGRPVP